MTEWKNIRNIDFLRKRELCRYSHISLLFICTAVKFKPRLNRVSIAICRCESFRDTRPAKFMRIKFSFLHLRLFAVKTGCDLFGFFVFDDF